MRVLTTQNSVYEINESDKLIRRVHSNHEPTPRQGADGVWQSYRSLEWLRDGLIIDWGDNPNGSAKCTWTSKVLTDSES